MPETWGRLSSRSIKGSRNGQNRPQSADKRTTPSYRLTLTMERQTVPKHTARPLPIVAGIGFISSLIDKSPPTIRRLERSDPDCPRSFKLDERGDRHWVVQE